MLELIMPLIIIIIIVAIGGIAYHFLVVKNKGKEDLESMKKEIVQKFVNVKDIKGKFLYTRNSMILSYIKIPLIDISLLTEKEKYIKANTLTAELSGERSGFKFLAVSRPVDITPLLTEYQNLYTSISNITQKELLRHEMNSISNFAISGEIVERQFYFVIWQKYEEGVEIDLSKRATEYISRFESAGIKASLVQENEIIRLCNLINNPSFANFEGSNHQATFPIIEMFS